MENMGEMPLQEIMVGIKGAGEMASGVAWRLWQANIRRIFMLEIPQPLAVRRKVSFCEAIYDGRMEVDGVTACRVESKTDIYCAWEKGCIAVMVDPCWKLMAEIAPQVVIDAILAKKNLGTGISEAPLVIGLGPGFTAGEDVRLVIETNRGHNLGRVLVSGAAEENTGIPGEIGGYAQERVLRAPVAGIFRTEGRIGDMVRRGEPVGDVGGSRIAAGVNGVIRGLLREGTKVDRGAKLGDIDPRGEAGYCYTVSDKALAIGGAALEAILRVYNQ
jgi:xanthine dehydrogenase accessory factor